MEENATINTPAECVSDDPLDIRTLCQRWPDELARIAHHEAGHCTAAQIVGQPIIAVRIDPQNPRRAKLRVILAPHFRVDRIDRILAR